MRNARPALIVGLVIAVITVVAFSGGCSRTVPHGGRYHCPMHPTYIADQPGDCPICGMRLVPIEERTAPTTVPAYACPMHPAVTSDQPGNCPECGMKLVPTGKPAPRTASGEAPRAGGPALEGAAPAAGRPENAIVEVTSNGLRLAGVQTEPAISGRLARVIRTVGSVTADETRIRHVHTKIQGWVEKLFVNFTGQAVRRGEPILSIYSQELVASQEEYLKARETAARFSTSELPEVRKGGDDLAMAARRRLELFDVPDAFIAELERTSQVRRTVTLDAPVSGFVTMKDVFEGQQVEPARELFTVADLSRVWVEAEIYEYEAGSLRIGEAAVVTLPHDAAVRLTGRIAFISPTLDTNTRTLKVRLELPNPGLALKPGMYATVELVLQANEGIVIPDSALMDTGERQVVFVSTGGGRFEPRIVTVGVRSGGQAQILSGVAAGEQVVIRANFLLDSESRLRAAIAGMATGSQVPGGGQ